MRNPSATSNTGRYLATMAWWLCLLPLVSGQSTNAGYPLPKPKHSVRVERSVMIPMRDGVLLSTDLYFPEGGDGKLPVILFRTPYNKKNFWQGHWYLEQKYSQTELFARPHDIRANPAAYVFASQGYVFAAQDVRGRYESEGRFTVSAADREDGSDAVTWLATQPWSNGKVGTYGCSYRGENQAQLAAERNPYHAAAIPQAAGGAYRYFGVLMGGAFELAAGFGWFRQSGSKFFLKPPVDASGDFYRKWGRYFDPSPSVPDADYRKMWRFLPVIDMIKVSGAPPSDWEGFVSHEPADPWWDQFGYVRDTDRFDVPALHVNSWYDLCVADTLQLFNLMRTNAESARGRENQFVIISPTTHCRSERVTERTVVGTRHLGDARFDYWGLYLSWFDYWLKGRKTAVGDMPKVRIFVMGKNEWREENEWPLARTQYTPFYLHSDGHANSRLGTGVLSTAKPVDEPVDVFVYDPEAPVTTVGGPICCTGTPDAPGGSFDQSQVEMRQDVLVFTTPSLPEGVEVTGPIEVVLYVSSTAKDTDFTAKLVDVYPDGTAYNIEESILRARYREGFDKKVWMTPEEVYELRIDLQVTSNYFGPGHQIRLEVTSSSFPRFVRNLNTGGDNFSETEGVVARNTVHHSARYPSHLLLPVIPEE